MVHKSCGNDNKTSMRMQLITHSLSLSFTTTLSQPPTNKLDRWMKNYIETGHVGGAILVSTFEIQLHVILTMHKLVQDC